MSRDSQYRHAKWHIEDATLTVNKPKLELLLDFDAPAHFSLPPNCPLRHGIRPAYVGCHGATFCGNQNKSVVAQTQIGMFGRVGGAAASGEEQLVTEWRELGVPDLTVTRS